MNSRANQGQTRKFTYVDFQNAMEMTEEKPPEELLPETIFDEYWGAGGDAGTCPSLRCTYGWDEKATEIFLAHAHEIATVRLLAKDDQRIEIPPLGDAARNVKRLYLDASGIVKGLEQFVELDFIDIESMPDGGIDLSVFPKLRFVAALLNKRDSKHIDDIFACTQLRELCFYEAYPEVDCRRYGALPHLRHAGFTQGPIRSLTGLEACSELEALDLTECRSFVDLGDLTCFPRLHTLDLESLPKLQWDVPLSGLKSLRHISLVSLRTLNGTISLTGLDAMEGIQILNCPNAVVDLAALGEMTTLRVIYIDAPCVNLDLDAMLSLPRLAQFWLPVAGELAESDDVLVKRAEQHGRKIMELKRTGPTKSRVVRVVLDDVASKLADQ